MCLYCTAKSRSCTPIWVASRPSPSIACTPCIKDKRRCSFRSEDWPISRWPTIQPSVERNKRRRKITENEVAVVSAVPMRESLSEGTVKGGPSAGTRSKGKGKGVARDSQTDPASVASPLPEPKPTIGSSVFAGPAGTQTPVVGRVEEVVFEDLNRYDQILCHPSRSSTMVASAIAELNAAISRERNHVSMLTVWIQDRAVVIDSLLEKMNAKMAELRDEEEDATRGSGTSRSHAAVRGKE